MKETRHVIKRVLPGSIAEELELEPGDELLSVNGQYTKQSGNGDIILHLPDIHVRQVYDREQHLYG